MDPSEYEDTVEKNADAVSAGALEKYFAEDIATQQLHVMEGVLKGLSTTLKSLSLDTFPPQELSTEWENLVIEITEYDEHEHREVVLSTVQAMRQCGSVGSVAASSEGGESMTPEIRPVSVATDASDGDVSVDQATTYGRAAEVFLREYEAGVSRRRIYEVFLCRW